MLDGCVLLFFQSHLHSDYTQISSSSLQHMFKLLQGGLSAVTGSAEPIYGPEAFQSITSTVEGRNPYGALTKEDLTWRAPYSSNVETQTFYFNQPKTGHYGMFQIIHSNPVGVHFTANFNCLVRNEKQPEDNIWTCTGLEEFVAKDTDFTANKVDFVLSKDLTTYVINSTVAPDTLVDVKIKRVAEGFKIGADGTSKYGEDLSNPWGTMRHVFWPNAEAMGKVTVRGKEIDLDGAQVGFIMALQGMKPHHAASRWNFVDFQGPTISSIVMDYTTPPSYGSSRCSFGGVTKDGKLIATFAKVTIEHKDAKEDDVGWPVPHGISFKLEGPKIEAADEDVDKPENVVTLEISGALTNMFDRVDVMAEIPAFIKSLASGISGTKPYIYQYSNPLKAALTVDGETFTEEGFSFLEATFIS